MATPEETFVLVEMQKITEAAINTETVGRPEIDREIIKRVIRTYLSNSRAQDDMELLREAAPAARYQIMPVTHIDN